MNAGLQTGDQHLGTGTQPPQSFVTINSTRPASRTTAEVACPRSMVGRVIGKNGETIKALQTYTGALIQIDQSTDPTRVTISGTPQSLSLAMSMVTDICKGTFKGFALLRQLIQPQRSNAPGMPAQPRPVYAPGYGLIPPSQLYGPEDQQQQLIQGQAVSVVGALPQGTLLQPGFQYVQTTPLGETQLLLAQPPGMPTHTLASQDGMTLLSSLPMQQQLQQVQQLPMQQVYTSVPVTTAGNFGAQMATFYQPSDLAGNEALGVTQDGTQYSLQPTQLAQFVGSNNTKMLSSAAAGGGMPMASGLRHQAVQQMRGSNGFQQMGGRQGGPGSAGSWAENATKPETMGQAAMNDLLGVGQGNAGRSPLGNGQQMGSNQGQLLRVMGPDGLSYYLQGEINQN